MASAGLRHGSVLLGIALGTPGALTFHSLAWV